MSLSRLRSKSPPRAVAAFPSMFNSPPRTAASSPSMFNSPPRAATASALSLSFSNDAYESPPRSKRGLF